MFKDIICLRVISPNFSTDRIELLKDSTTWLITDDDFQEKQKSMYGPVGAIIELYENKKLNVAKNLLLYFKSYESLHGLTDPAEEICIEKQMKFQLKHNELYKKYDEDVRKYLLLI